MRPAIPFDVALRELSPQAAAQTRTYRARLKPVERAAAAARRHRHAGRRPRHVGYAQVAAMPATALTQSNGQPALWVVKRSRRASRWARVELLRVVGARLPQRRGAGLRPPPGGAQVVTAGVQKMAPGLNVALPISLRVRRAETNKAAAR